MLYDRYAGVAYGLAYRITTNAATAEDVVQDAFVSLWKQAPRFDPERGACRQSETNASCTTSSAAVASFVTRHASPWAAPLYRSYSAATASWSPLWIRRSNCLLYTSDAADE